MGKRTSLKNKRFIEKIVFSLPAYFLCILLIAPFCFFGLQWELLPWEQVLPLLSVFCWTLFQALASAGGSLILAILSSLGLLYFAQKKYYVFIEALVVLPCFLPPLLLVLSFVQIVEKIMPFPFGLMALISVQILSFTGLCAVALTRRILKSAGSFSEWAYVHGASSRSFFKMLLKSVLWKDVQILFILVFTSSFTSLSFPFLVAGSSLFSLEFFIYENLKNVDLWPQTMSLILFQSFFIFFICWRFFSKGSSSLLPLSHKKILLLPKALLALIPFSILALSVGGLFLILERKAFLELFALRHLILHSALNSLIVSLTSGFLILIFLIFMSLSFQNRFMRRFIASFTPPGTAFMGLVFLMIPLYGKTFILIKWIGGLSLLIFPWIYRFQGERVLESMTNQVETARFLGAGWGLIFRDIIFQQNRKLFFLCAGLTGWWVCGDFSYSLIVSHGEWNLALLVYDLFSSYRLDEAVLLSWLLLLFSFFIFLFWMGVAFVFDKKLIL